MNTISRKTYRLSSQFTFIYIVFSSFGSLLEIMKSLKSPFNFLPCIKNCLGTNPKKLVTLVLSTVYIFGGNNVILARKFPKFWRVKL